MSMNLTTKKKLEFIEIITQTPVTATIIWLHGLGADGHDFVNLVPELNLPSELGVRFIFPHAPMRPITLNGGMEMRGWFDITSLTRLEYDLTGIAESTENVQYLIQEQIDLGIAYDRILLAGFSQGGAIALHAAINYPHVIGGVLGLSTYLPASEKIVHHINPLKYNMPIALYHGLYDNIIPIELAKMGRDFLMNQNFQVEWREYAMAHQLCLPEIKDIQQWILKTLASRLG